MKKFLLVTAVAALTSASAFAAGPATATFDVLLKVVSACTVTAGSGSNINFGSVDSNAGDQAKTNNISVTCSKKTPYFVGLKSLANSSTTGAGTMQPQNTAPVTGNTDTVGYQLYSDSGHANVWGNTGTNTTVGNGVSGTGNGTAQSIPVYAKVLSAALNVTPDDYKDTVTVTVRY